jgi:hypothetical protein
MEALAGEVDSHRQQGIKLTGATATTQSATRPTSTRDVVRIAARHGCRG